MASATSKSPYWQGFRDGSPFILVVAPFALLFGVVAKDAGLNLFETLTMSFLVVAGAAQFTALSLLQEQAPTFIVIFTALAVNLRMAMYSAALVPHFGTCPMWLRGIISYFMVDQAFVVAAFHYEQNPKMSQREKVIYYFGCLSPIVPLWFLFSGLGVVIGQAIPPSYSLDFAIPICFIALTAPAMRSFPHFIAAFVSIVMSLAFAWLPYSLGIIVAALIAMAVGAQVELWLKGRGHDI